VSAVTLGGWLAALCALGGLAWLRARQLSLVADAGHELRGPLCAARLGLHALGDDERAAAVDLELRRAALALDDLVAAGRGRRSGARSELVDVGALLDDGAEAWQPLAAAFGAVVVVEPMRGRALVRADPARLAQACGNLVANAVEHGGSPVRVRGRVVAGRVRIEVSDAGPGLPGPVSELVTRRRRLSRALPELFAPTRGVPARGRGLAIAARIAETSGGRLSPAPSASGARLVLEFPSADAAPAVAPLHKAGPPPADTPSGLGPPGADTPSGLGPPPADAPPGLGPPGADTPLWPQPWQIWPPEPLPPRPAREPLWPYRPPDPPRPSRPRGR
jgi:hypothetical protein